MKKISNETKLTILILLWILDKAVMMLLLWIMRQVGWMDNYEFMEILKHLVQEKKDLQKRLDVMEEILHSYIPIIEDKKKES